MVALARGVVYLVAKVPGLRAPRLTFIVSPINQLDKLALTSLNGQLETI